MINSIIYILVIITLVLVYVYPSQITKSNIKEYEIDHFINNYLNII
jgi:hypothetical protein